ncbi:MAG: hypothetical protein IPP77_03605 [Bacteroidetes bacterium]|nr:hypothetical protein [Bacteroidota bacterium]
MYFENGSGAWKWRVRYGERIVVTSYGLGYEDRDECLAEIAKLKQTLGDFLDKNS